MVFVAMENGEKSLQLERKRKLKDQSDVSTRAGSRGIAAALAKGEGRPAERGSVLAGGFSREHIINRVGEIVDAGDRHDDHVAVPLALLGDAEKSSATVLAQIDRENLPLDLQLSCFKDAVHFQKVPMLHFRPVKMEANFSGTRSSGAGAARSSRMIADDREVGLLFKNIDPCHHDLQHFTHGEGAL